jgi:hypothetical protein
MSSIICNTLGNRVFNEFIFDPSWQIPSGTAIQQAAIIDANEATAKVKLALHTANPGSTADPSFEVTGEGYERQVVGWSSSSSKLIGNIDKITFEDMPECTVTHIAVWSVETESQCLMTLELDDPLVVGLSDAVVIPPNNLVFSL